MSAHTSRAKFSLVLLAVVAAIAVATAGCGRPKEGTPTPPPVSGTPGVPVVPGLAADGYVAVVPIALRSGYDESVSVSLFNGDRPVSGDVRLAVLKDDVPVAETRVRVNGSAAVPLKLPRLPSGQYQVQVDVEGVPSTNNRASVRVEEGTVLFLETDKPIYKPGQTVHVRIITLDALLKPRVVTATVDVQDAKGIKVFKTDVTSDAYGMVTVDLPLSTEPNLGVWKVTATAGEQKQQLDVRVEEYVLPKYEVSVSTSRGWVLANERVKGTVSAEYTFGKPVVGDVEIVASRYVGQWEEFARFSGPINGETTFDLPSVGYVAGVPGAQGQGNVALDVAVREKATGYEEKSTRLLTVAATPINLQVISESTTFKPGLPFSYIIVAETPDGQPLDKKVDVTLTYMGKDFDAVKQEKLNVTTIKGKAIVGAKVPDGAIALNLEATSEQAHAALTLNAGHSPSGNFINVEQVTEGDIEVGDAVRFHVASTKEARNFYFEVIARGMTLFTDVSTSPDIALVATQLMAPEAKLLVYQILPNNEVAADYIPFSVEGIYPNDVSVAFSRDTVQPGDPVDINLQTQGESRVGLVAVDKSVFILAENRLNLQQVFDELERLYQQPQAELHDVRFRRDITTRGAEETFKEAGTVVLTNKNVPSGEKYQNQIMVLEAAPALAGAWAQADSKRGGAGEAPSGLAEVQRVRQFFPETWIWQDVFTDASGRSTVPVIAPDSITTWMMRAVAVSTEKGLGIGETQLKVFQPFFLTVDLPYSVIRGEEFPIKVALFNYLDVDQEIYTEIEQADWFDLLDDPAKTATVAANDIGGVAFTIRPKKLGTNQVKVTARSTQVADAVVRDLLVEPEGVQREIVENHVLGGGDRLDLYTGVPSGVVEGSGRAYLAVTGSYLTQTIDGLEALLRMPFGCGEQNMILFAPNVYVARYLKETGQLKPEIMAKAEHLMMTGYQRELTYRRADGSFSAFGDSDEEGSLWLTAFVVKTFAEAEGLMYIDGSVVDDAVAWVVKHQHSDGSFESVGFLHHQELLGGLQGKDALTAYVTVALLEAGETSAANRAVRYLEGRVSGMDDAYAMAIASYVLGLADSPLAGTAHDRLMGMAKDDGQGGLYWGEEIRPIEPLTPVGGPAIGVQAKPADRFPQAQSASIETTGYAVMALLTQADLPNGSRGSRWLVGQRNALGGFGSTQDTIVGLQALTGYAAKVKSNVDMVVTLTGSDWRKDVHITPQTSDVLQTIQVPLNATIAVVSSGTGDVVLQSVVRYNLPQEDHTSEAVFDITVDYGTDHVAVDDLITVSATISFNPPEPIEAGMVVLDVSVPTGFEPVRETVAALVEKNADVKRFEVAGRKVILYIDDMHAGDILSFRFQARALYPVRAKEVTSQAYSYYRPEWRGETLAGAMVVAE